jgi:hypothetical protein
MTTRSKWLSPLAAAADLNGMGAMVRAVVKRVRVICTSLRVAREVETRASADNELWGGERDAGYVSVMRRAVVVALTVTDLLTRVGMVREWLKRGRDGGERGELAIGFRVSTDSVRRLQVSQPTTYVESR